MKNNFGLLLVICFAWFEGLKLIKTEMEPFYKHSLEPVSNNKSRESGGVVSNSGGIKHIQFDNHSNTSRQDFTYILPTSWQQFCTVKYKLVSGSNFTARNAFVILCRPGNQDVWSLHGYRAWISSLDKNFDIPVGMVLSFAFQFQCTDGSARISLPLPVKAVHLWYMSVDNCTIVDQLAEYNMQQYNIPDTLRVLEITNSLITFDTQTFFEKTRNYQNTSRDFFCGSEMLERFVLRNNTKTFTQLKPREIDLAAIKPITTHKTSEEAGSNGKEAVNGTVKGAIPQNESEMSDIFARFTQDHLKVMYQCNHKNLNYLEESYQHTMSRHHSHFMLEKAHYPQLQYFNLSHSGIHHMGPHMLDWRRYFPRMKYMDLSYNHIKYFSSLTDNGMSADSGGVLDLRNNNITTLTPDDLEALSLQSRTVAVDIRNNPIVCDCKLQNFINMLHNQTVKLHEKYDYLHELTCKSPQKHKGKTLASLEEEFCELLSYIVLSTPLVVVSCFSALSLVAFIVGVKYRKEIMILAFTRFHISLPCRKVYKSNNKKYDAFIAYCEQDCEWVFHTLLPRLENTEEHNGPGLKLCIHHRDFPIGGCISDNILDKIKDSRHTVLILSNNFLKSHWCKYEFKAAFTQSIMEKKQHLIMVLQEELDKKLIDKTLERCLKTFTYVKADDRLFWDKIIYALSDRRKNDIVSSKYSCKYLSSGHNSSSVTIPNGSINGGISIISSNGQAPPVSNTAEQNRDQSMQNGCNYISKREAVTTDLLQESNNMVTSNGVTQDHTSTAITRHNGVLKTVPNGAIAKCNGVSPSTKSRQTRDSNGTPEVSVGKGLHTIKTGNNVVTYGKNVYSNDNGHANSNNMKEREPAIDNVVIIDEHFINECNITLDNSDCNNDWSLMSAMSPWFKAWFSGSNSSSIQNTGETGSRTHLQRNQ